MRLLFLALLLCLATVFGSESCASDSKLRSCHVDLEWDNPVRDRNVEEFCKKLSCYQVYKYAIKCPNAYRDLSKVMKLVDIVNKIVASGDIPEICEISFNGMKEEGLPVNYNTSSGHLLIITCVIAILGFME